MPEAPGNRGRRDFLKRAAIVAAGTAWAAPTLQTLAAGSAAAGSAAPDQGCLTGLVKLPTGAPAVGVPVWVYTGLTPGPGATDCTATGYLSTTGADGRYTLCLPAGLQTVRAGDCPSTEYSQDGANVTIVTGIGQTQDFQLGPPCSGRVCACFNPPGSVLSPCPG